MTWVVLTSSPDYIVLHFIISIWREFINLFKLYLNLWKTINSRCHRTRKFVSKFSIPMNTYRITKWNCSPPMNKQFILADNVCKFILSFFQYPFCSASTYSSNFLCSNSHHQLCETHPILDLPQSSILPTRKFRFYYNFKLYLFSRKKLININDNID